jgi:Transposase
MIWLSEIPKSSLSELNSQCIKELGDSNAPSKTTIWRFLKKQGLFSFKPNKKPLLKNKNLQKRFFFAQDILKKRKTSSQTLPGLTKLKLRLFARKLTFL